MLLKLVISVLVCPVNQNAAMTARFFERENELLKRLFSPYLSATSVDATIIGYRDRDYNVLEEVKQETALTRNGDHPLYPRSSFDSKEDFELWKDLRLSDLSHKTKILERQPSYTGKLTISVMSAKDLNANKERPEGNSSIYYIVKVEEQVQRSTQYVENTWDPDFAFEPFTFDVPSRDCRVKIEVWNKNFIGSTFLGCVMSKPKDLMWLDMPYEKWWPLGSRTRTKDTGICGSLLIRFDLSFQIGPYRAPAPTASKGVLAQLLSSALSPSSAPNSAPGSPKGTSPHDSDEHHAFDVNASQSGNLTTSSDSEVLPPPPPIVNSHLNDYPEWFSSLLLMVLKDALNHPPPPPLSASVSDDGSVEESPNSSNSAAISAPVAIHAHQTPLTTPLRSSPSVSVLGYVQKTPFESAEKSRHERRRSDLIPVDLNSSFATAATPTPQGSLGTSSALGYGSSDLGASSSDWGSGGGAYSGYGIGTPSKAHSAMSHMNDSPTSGIPRDAIAKSTSDLLTSSSGSLSRSAPSIRAMTPSKRNLVHTRVGTAGSMGSVEEEPVEEPVRYIAEMKWLLDCFVERFTVDICLPPLLMIELLDASFSARSSVHMEHLHAALVEFESAKALAPLRWMRVVQLHEHVICESLKQNLNDAITNYFWRFPRNEPRGALSQAIVLYSMITRSEIPQLCLILHDKIEATMIKMYKTIVGEKTPTEATMWDAIRVVSQAVDIDVRYFNEVFPENLMLASLSMRTYYGELLSKNLKAWLRTSPPITDLTMTMYSHLNRLHSQLNRLQSGIATNNFSSGPLELLPLASLFQPFVGKWIEHVGENLPQWAKYDLLRRETWRSASSANGSHSSGSILHSASAQALFEAFNRVYTQYRQFDMRTAKDMKALVKIFVAALEGYMQVMAGKVVEIFAIQGAPKGSKGGRYSPALGRNSPLSARGRTGSSGDVYALASQHSSYQGAPPDSARYGGGHGASSSSSFWSSFAILPSVLSGSSASSKLSSSTSTLSRTSSDRGLFHIPAESCVWISTLQTISHKLYEFCKQISNDSEKGSEEVRGWFGDTFSQLQQLENQICQLIIKLINTNPSIELALDTLLTYSPDIEKVTDADVLMKLEPLFDYIGARIEFLSSHLDYKVLLRLLEQIWLVILKDIEVLTFPIISDRKADAKRAHFVEFALPFLVTYFHGREDGLGASLAASGANVGYPGANHASLTSSQAVTSSGGTGGITSHSHATNYDGLSLEFLEAEAIVLKTAFSMLKCPTGVLCKAHTDIANGLSPTGVPGSDGVDHLLLETRIIAVLSMRKNDKEAKKYVKANKLPTMNRYTLRSFDLPKGETIVDWFTCRKGKETYVSGYLYITTNWLCFDTYLWGDQMLTVPLSEIRSLKRKKTTLSTNGITIRLRDGSATLQFSALNKIKAYDVIIEQATKLGYVLETYDKNADSDHHHHKDHKDGKDHHHKEKKKSKDKEKSTGSESEEDSFSFSSSSTQALQSGSNSGSSLAPPTPTKAHKRSKSSDVGNASSSGSKRNSRESPSAGATSSAGSNANMSAHQLLVAEALQVTGAKEVENEEDMKSHFGLAKTEAAIVSFDCALMLEPKDKSLSISSLGAATPSQAGVLYCFTKSLCFRCPSHKLVLTWNSVSNLGQRGTDGILIVAKEKKKAKQHCLTKFAAPDDVFALLHSIWVKARS